MMLLPIPHPLLPIWYERAQPYLAEIADGSGGRLNEASIAEALLAREFWLALILDEENTVLGAILVQPITWKTGFREASLMLAGLGLAQWEHLEPQLAEMLRSEGFAVARDWGGRKGMERVAAKYGWKSTGVVLEKDLRHA